MAETHDIIDQALAIYGVDGILPAEVFQGPIGSPAMLQLTIPAAAYLAGAEIAAVELATLDGLRLLPANNDNVFLGGVVGFSAFASEGVSGADLSALLTSLELVLQSGAIAFPRPLVRGFVMPAPLSGVGSGFARGMGQGPACEYERVLPWQAPAGGAGNQVFGRFAVGVTVAVQSVINILVWTFGARRQDAGGGATIRDGRAGIGACATRSADSVITALTAKSRTQRAAGVEYPLAWNPPQGR